MYMYNVFFWGGGGGGYTVKAAGEWGGFVVGSY